MTSIRFGYRMRAARLLLGPAPSAVTTTFQADTDDMHLLIAGVRIATRSPTCLRYVAMLAGPHDPRPLPPQSPSASSHAAVKFLPGPASASASTNRLSVRATNHPTDLLLVAEIPLAHLRRLLGIVNDGVGMSAGAGELASGDDEVLVTDRGSGEPRFEDLPRAGGISRLG